MYPVTLKGQALLLLVLFAFASLQGVQAQGPDTYELTLEEVVAIAQSDAPDALLAETRWKRSYWTYQTFIADFKPQIVLNANTLPRFNRSIEPITLPTGEEAFRARAFMDNSLNVAMEQVVAPTGGTLFVGTGLSRLDVFETEGIAASTSYLSTPVSIGFVQPLFQFNGMKWQKEIEPMLYQEREKEYSEEMETVASDAAGLFFDLLVSQLDAVAAERDKAAADTLLTLSRGRFEVGKIAETDMLQIELNAMQAEARLAEAQLNMQTNAERLRDFLGIRGNVNFDLVPPYDLPDIHIDPQQALAYATQHRSDIVEYDRTTERKPNVKWPVPKVKRASRRALWASLASPRPEKKSVTPTPTCSTRNS